MEADTTMSAANATEASPQCAVLPQPMNNATPVLIVCKFFQLGCCRFGTSCRFVHPVDSQANSIIRVDTEKGEVGVSPSTGVGTAAREQESEANNASNTPKLTSTTFDPSKWINAPVFVPKSRMSYESGQRKKEEGYVDENADNERPIGEDLVNEDSDDGARGSLSYANVVTLNNNHNGNNDGGLVHSRASATDSRLCSYYEKHGQCSLQDCVYEHGLKCELCDKFCMHPHDADQRRRHTAACIGQHERDMEHSFAVQRSRDKSCGICLEVIMEKRPREQRFGILPNCKHVFCLNCIRTWRKANNFENKIKRGCPTCRIPSDFVCPSYVWIESEEDKAKMIEDYKDACNSTDCMHFKKGNAKCPFGNKCFYRHALPTGERVDVGAPPRRRVPGRRRNHDEAMLLQDLLTESLAPRAFVNGILNHPILFDEYFLTDDEDSDTEDLNVTFDIDMNYIYGGGGSDDDDDDFDDDIYLDVVTNRGRQLGSRRAYHQS